MKFNPVMLAIALAIAGLAAFGFFAGNSGEPYRWVLTIGAGFSLAVTLCGLLAFSTNGGTSVNIKVTSVLFFIALLIEHLIFSFTAIKLAPYIIITGILILVYVLISYAISKA
jgi:hypothetical protein